MNNNSKQPRTSTRYTIIFVNIMIVLCARLLYGRSRSSCYYYHWFYNSLLVYYKINVITYLCVIAISWCIISCKRNNATACSTYYIMYYKYVPTLLFCLFIALLHILLNMYSVYFILPPEFQSARYGCFGGKYADVYIILL